MDEELVNGSTAPLGDTPSGGTPQDWNTSLAGPAPVPVAFDVPADSSVNAATDTPIDGERSVPAPPRAGRRAAPQPI